VCVLKHSRAGGGVGHLVQVGVKQFSLFLTKNENKTKKRFVCILKNLALKNKNSVNLIYPHLVVKIKKNYNPKMFCLGNF
jgi:hypothetical protein